PVPGAGRAHGAVGQGLGHRGELHPPDGGGGAAVRAAEAARAHAGDRVPPGRGVGAAPRRRGAGAVRQDPRRDVPPRRPRHGRPGPPGVQQGRPHEHRRPPPPPQPHTGLPGGSGQDELRRAAAGQGAVEQGVQGLPQGKAPVVAAARTARWKWPRRASTCGSRTRSCGARCAGASSREGSSRRSSKVWRYSRRKLGGHWMPRLIRHIVCFLYIKSCTETAIVVRSINKKKEGKNSSL
ncbi:hypothetical protein ACJX0J_023429, partial [Zea mays]